MQTLNVLVNFYQNYTPLFWLIIAIIASILICGFLSYAQAKEEEEEQKGVEEHNRKINKKIKEQLSNINEWKGKMINVLSSSIAESCQIQEVVHHENYVKLVLQGHEEFLVMNLPYVKDEKSIKVRGKVINPNQKEKTSTLNDVKKFVKSPTGLGVGAVIISNFAYVLAAPFSLIWKALNSGNEEEDIIQFVFTE